MSKKKIEVPESWFFQAKENAEIATEQSLQIEAMESHIRELELTIDAQNKVLKNELGMVPISTPEQLNEIATELCSKAEELDEREHNLIKEYAESNGVPFTSGGDIKQFVKSLTKSKEEAN